MGFLGYLGISSALVPAHQSTSSLLTFSLSLWPSSPKSSSLKNPSLIIATSSFSLTRSCSLINARSMILTHPSLTQIIAASSLRNSLMTDTMSDMLPGSLCVHLELALREVLFKDSLWQLVE